MAASTGSDGIRRKLEEQVVRPLFARVRISPDRSLPEVVIANRQQRARERLLEALVSRGSAKVPRELQRRVDKLVREWAARSFEDGFGAVQELEIQCARQHDLVVAEESGDDERVLAVLEQEYRRRVVEEFGTIELRGIQVSHRVMLDLDRVYVPLHLEQTPEGEELPLLRQRVSVDIALKQNRQVVIVGSPGSGKTTLVSYLATGLADGRLAKDLGLPERALPLVVAVRSLKDASLQFDLDERLVASALDGRRAVLLVDGLDEAPDEMRRQLVASLTRFAEEHTGTAVIVTSRPTGAPGEIEQAFGKFRPFRLADLETEEVEQFIDKWCLAAEESVRKDDARKQSQAAAEELKAGISGSRPIQRIAGNPLLATILCVVHRFFRSIPLNRVRLYESCTDALLYEWDRAKFPEGAAVGGLDAPQKRVLLQPVARTLHEQHAAEISENEVVRLFGEALPDLGKAESDAQRIVHEIRDRSGLLVQRRPGYFGFSHLTFQEYLTALDYVARKQLDKLVEHWQDPWWQEVIPLAAGIPGSDSARITRGLLATKELAATILAAQCLETAINMPLEVRQHVEKALEAVVPPRDFPTASRLAAIGMIAAPLLLKGLSKASSEEVRWTMHALAQIDYDPAIPTIARYISDDKAGQTAVIALCSRARRSTLAKRALAAELRQPRSATLTAVRIYAGLTNDVELRQMLDSALKAARRGKPSSTPSKSTA